MEYDVARRDQLPYPLLTLFVHNRMMTDRGRFVAQRWEVDHVAAWRSWVSGTESSRITDLRRLAEAVGVLTRRWADDSESASSVIQQLPLTMSACNYLAFDTEAETLAYTIWHLVDRYGRILQVLDELLAAGHLPIRRKRMSVLEVGAGPSPAAYAVSDYYRDLQKWSESLGESQVKIQPVSDLRVLDHGPAWGHLVHRLSEDLISLGERDGRARIFNVAYNKFGSFSVRAEHLSSIERSKQQLVAEADSRDECLSEGEAHSKVIKERAFPPGSMDLIVMCNFLTQESMVNEFATEIEMLAESLTPGGLLVAIGSSGSDYNVIFSRLTQLATRKNRTRLVSLNKLGSFQAHVDGRIHDVIEESILDCLCHLEITAPDSFSLIRDQLHSEVRRPRSKRLTFPSFRLAVFKNESPRSHR